MPRETGHTLAAQNKRVHHDYRVGKTYKAGLVLAGTEVKTLRMGRISLAKTFATANDGEVWLRNVNIPEYKFETWRNHAARRSRKLLLNRRRITRPARETEATGGTIAPLSICFKGGYTKMEITVATGKKDWNKRRGIAEYDTNRGAQRALQMRNWLGSGRR